MIANIKEDLKKEKDESFDFIKMIDDTEDNGGNSFFGQGLPEA